ncbi:hypothetical protein GKQ38_05255 [Candidatus Nanohaloarchaea archaeon]|nr:hypothetical protein GKQ38_05255 [Candidatus Nanohaloarchaea archaeon]
MDKLLEIVMAAVVISVTGLAVLFALNSQSGSFMNFLDSQSQDARCDMLKDKYDRAAENENVDRYTEINQKASNMGCEWATGGGGSPSLPTGGGPAPATP